MEQAVIAQGPVDVTVRRRVVCAAIRDMSGRVVCGARHFDIGMVRAIKEMMSFVEPWEQGFIDQRGEFMTREEAHKVAADAGQIIRRCGGDDGRLFSENLY